MKIELNPVKWVTSSKAVTSPAKPVVVPAAVVELLAVQKATQSRMPGTITISSVTGSAFSVHPSLVQHLSSSAKAVENTMSTTATPVAAASQPNGFIRFIDAIGHFFVKSAPVLEAIAVDAEPFLALTPFGPEYDLVVNAIVGAQKTATASLTAGATLTGAQKMALVLEAVTPGLSQILASKKVTSGVPTAIDQFAQNVYNLQTGPTTTVAPVAAAAKP